MKIEDQRVQGPDLLDAFAELIAVKVAEKLSKLQPKPPVHLYSIVQVAEMINRSKAAVQHLIARGDLPGIKIGRRVQVEAEALQRWIQQNRTESER